MTINGNTPLVITSSVYASFLSPLISGAITADEMVRLGRAIGAQQTMTNGRGGLRNLDCQVSPALQEKMRILTEQGLNADQLAGLLLFLGATALK
jgi:hypothetical protein